MNQSSGKFLLDSNLLIAISAGTHTSHSRAISWLAEHNDVFALCPITQGAMIRFHTRIEGIHGSEVAFRYLSSLEQDHRYQFWPADLDFSCVANRGIRGHHQVTDLYLAQLAFRHGGRLATMDQGLAAWQKELVFLIP